MPPSLRPSLAVRLLHVGAGTGVAAYGYLLTVSADLGNGPLFAIQDGLCRQLGLSLGVSATLVGLAVVAIAAALRAPLGPATLVMPVLNGVWIAALEPFVLRAEGSGGRWIAFVGGTAVMMLGAVIAVRAALGASALDGVMLGLARRVGTSPARARLVMELAMVGGGAAMGGRVGAGTVVMGATVGHLYDFWVGVLRRLAPTRGEAAPVAG